RVVRARLRGPQRIRPGAPAGRVRDLEPAVGREHRLLEPAGGDQAVRVALEDLRAVRIAEVPRVRARTAVAAAEEGDALRRAAAHHDGVVVLHHIVDLGTRGAV